MNAGFGISIYFSYESAFHYSAIWVKYNLDFFFKRKFTMQNESCYPFSIEKVEMKGTFHELLITTEDCINLCASMDVELLLL